VRFVIDGSSAVAVAAGEGPKIGIALSGGGSRAMAFHLGCLRTLHRLGILERTRVLSTVSGGSVIGAMYAVHDGTFEEFEHRVRAVLVTGFMWPMMRSALTTPEGLKAALAFLLLVAGWLWMVPFRCLAGVISWVVGARQQGHVGTLPERWLPRRFASRTTILRRTFDRMLFQGRVLGSLRTDRPKLIAVAAELRTGSAFYYGRHDAGNWRFGKIDPAQIPISQVVVASAAYPLLLPAMDEFLTFRKRDGSLGTERVTLTDGGVYDNLGLSPLWPDRDREISVGVEDVDTIVACRAGYGPRTKAPSLFLGSRMKAVFGCTSNRVQNLSTKRLFDLKAAGRLKAFVLPYLDQADERLAYPPADLVRREAIAGYPTNFSAMPVEWIERLSKRGEQLTLAVIREHAPELLSPGWENDGHQPTQPSSIDVPPAQSSMSDGT
jgi:NTE family protein